MLFKPDIYKKNIFSIDYNKLKETGITCLIFDLDNTLGLLDNITVPIRTKILVNKLRKDFKIFIISNNTKKRIFPYTNDLEVEGLSSSLKPLTKSLRKVKRKYGFKKEEMAIIGDQLVTDILCGKLYHIKTILVDPLGKKDLKITGFNRWLEKRIINRYQRKGVFERGKYYE